MSRKIGNTYQTDWETLWIQALASVDKNEFRVASAASPYVAGRRSSEPSGRGVGAVVDNEVHLTLVFHGLVSDYFSKIRCPFFT